MSKIVEYGEVIAKGKKHLHLSDSCIPAQGVIRSETGMAHAAAAIAYFAYAKELREAVKDGWW